MTGIPHLIRASQRRSGAAILLPKSRQEPSLLKKPMASAWLG
jgi:hypothetical protein